jgi:tRNA A-37 threonylcarbamoyl transferase component Bud32
MNLLHRKALAARKKNMKNALKKCLRTNKRHERISKGPHRAVLSRDFFDATDFSELVKNLDRTMQQGEYLKNGNTCFVSKVSFAGKEVVVKRYNHKGLLHSLRHTLKRSRARRSWLNANRLTLLKIPTPKPVAFIEQYKMGVLWQSYLLTEHAPGQKLWDLLRDENLNQQQRLEISEQLKRLLDKLAKHRITHGDLKHTNVLITDHGPVLTDLDALRVHRTNWGHARRSARDRARLEQIHTPGV